MNEQIVGESWIRRALVGLLVLVILAPVFGWAAGAVGYTEPLEHAAEATGASGAVTTLHPGLLPDYGVPGVSAPVGTVLSAVIGTALTLLIALLVGRLLEK